MSQLMTADPGPIVLNPLSLLDKAIDKGVPIDQLTRLFDLIERSEKAAALRAWSDAVTKFQAKCPRVTKRRTATVRMKENKGEYSYQFANFEDIDVVAAPLLAEFGIVVSFTTEHVANGNMPAIKCTCFVRVGTHVEPTTLTVPVPQMTVNDTQRYAAALSYAKRYTMQAALKIVCQDEDDDGQSLVVRVSDAEIAHIQREFVRTGVKEQAFLHWLNTPELGQIVGRDYPNAQDYLRRKPTVTHEFLNGAAEEEPPFCVYCGKPPGDQFHQTPEKPEKPAPAGKEKKK